jgi:hypothetical protein
MSEISGSSLTSAISGSSLMLALNGRFPVQVNVHDVNKRP